jgi:hypothetical protein
MKKLFLTAFLSINIFVAYAQSFTLKGVVVNEINEPIAGVMVNVEESQEIRTLTNSNGKFEITLPDTMKYHTIMFSATDYIMQKDHIWNKTDIRIVMIKAKKNGRIYGTVRDKLTGETIPFAFVVVLSSEGKIVAGNQTDFYGKYIRIVPPDTYTLQISCIGYQIQQISDIIIDEEKVVPQDITLEPDPMTLQTIDIEHIHWPLFESE